MTRHDFMVKWGVYALALVPVWFLESLILSRGRIFGLTPMLLPLAAAAVAVLEGTVGGAGFGVAVGLLSTVVYHGNNAWMIVYLALAGLGAGLLTQYFLRQDLLGCLVCALLTLAGLDGVRIILWMVGGRAPLDAMLRLAGREIGVSMLFAAPVYLLFRWVFRRVPKSTHF